jgi:hypothetical protein
MILTRRNARLSPMRFSCADAAHLAGPGGLPAAPPGEPAPAPADEPRELRRFRMLAYTGASMVIPGYDFPVVIDLAGLEVPSQARPVLRQHDPARIIGHTETVLVGSEVTVSGVVSGAGEDAQEVIRAADNGFPWQVSVGADPIEVESVGRGVRVTVNGREFEGPLFVAAVQRLQRNLQLLLMREEEVRALKAALRAVTEASHTPLPQSHPPSDADVC